MSKVKCYSVRLECLVSISEKAYKATAYDGSEAIIPKSAVFGQDYEVQKSEAYWIAAFALNNSKLQYSTKKVFWFEGEFKTAKPAVSEESKPKGETGTPEDILSRLLQDKEVHFTRENEMAVINVIVDNNLSVEKKVTSQFNEEYRGFFQLKPVKGYWLEWKQVRLYDGPYGRKRDTNRQHIRTYQGPVSNAPKSFLSLSDIEFEMAKKKEGKMIEPYTTPDFAKIIEDEISKEEIAKEREKQMIIEAENKKIADAQAEAKKLQDAKDLAAKIEELKAAGIPSTLNAWKQLGCIHPAPAEVVEAKNASGLNWKLFVETII